jgi:hypothetical protein
MTRVLGAVLRGVGVGLAMGATVGALTAVILTTTGWPSADTDPTARARHLGESISEGMHVAFMASAVLAPACAIFFVRRTRRQQGPRA